MSKDKNSFESFFENTKERVPRPPTSWPVVILIMIGMIILLPLIVLIFIVLWIYDYIRGLFK